MDLRHFRYVQKIAEERSFSRAAEKLYIAQPALSQYVLNLERSLGTKLFDRSKNPITLTYAGELFLKKAQMIIEIEDELHNEIKNFNKSDKGRLIVAISPNRGSYILPKILPGFSQIYPNVEIKLMEGLTGNFIDWLNKDMADVAIMPMPPEHENIELVPIQTEDILLTLPPEHPMIKNAKETGADYPVLELNLFKNETFILSKPGQGLRNMAQELFAATGFKPKVYLETQSSETAHRLALSGVGIAFSATTLGPLNMGNELKYFRLAEKSPHRDIVVAYKRRNTLPWTIKEFVAITKDTMQAYNVSEYRGKRQAQKIDKPGKDKLDQPNTGANPDGKTPKKSVRKKTDAAKAVEKTRRR